MIAGVAMLPSQSKFLPILWVKEPNFTLQASREKPTIRAICLGVAAQKA